MINCHIYLDWGFRMRSNDPLERDKKIATILGKLRTTIEVQLREQTKDICKAVTIVQRHSSGFDAHNRQDEIIAEYSHVTYTTDDGIRFGSEYLSKKNMSEIEYALKVAYRKANIVDRDITIERAVDEHLIPYLVRKIRAKSNFAKKHNDDVRRISRVCDILGKTTSSNILITRKIINGLKFDDPYAMIRGQVVENCFKSDSLDAVPATKKTHYDIISTAAIKYAESVVENEVDTLIESYVHKITTSNNRIKEDSARGIWTDLTTAVYIPARQQLLYLKLFDQIYQSKRRASQTLNILSSSFYVFCKNQPTPLKTSMVEDFKLYTEFHKNIAKITKQDLLNYAYSIGLEIVAMSMRANTSKEIETACKVVESLAKTFKHLRKIGNIADKNFDMKLVADMISRQAMPSSKRYFADTAGNIWFSASINDWRTVYLRLQLVFLFLTKVYGKTFITKFGNAKSNPADLSLLI